MDDGVADGRGDFFQLPVVPAVFHDLDSKKEVTYTILGPADIDLSNNIISFKSPLARGMITKKVGDVIKIIIPEGERNLKIMKIERYFPLIPTNGFARRDSS